MSHEPSDPSNASASATDAGRRRLLRTAAAGLTGALFASGTEATPAAAAGKDAEDGPAVRNGRIKQSIVQWCFAKYWTMEETAKIAVRLGCRSVELVGPTHWPMLKQHGLTCAIAGVDMSPHKPFEKGFNNPEHRDRVVRATLDSIAACAAHGVGRVIAFTGMRDGMPDDVGLKNCVDGLKLVMAEAERKKVDVCLEMLNTRDASHPMKGHPGYQGDHTDYCIEIVKQVGSPRMKLLFDVYHVQIMDGDVIRRIRQHREHIGHVHTAGNPGRGELDDAQEINYPPIMRALLEIGYDGYVGQEFIPTRDPLAGLRQAVSVCDV